MNPSHLCKVFGDRYLMLILAATYIKPRGAREISRMLKISIPVAYRKIDILQKMGLLKCAKTVLTRSGKRLKIYEPTHKKLTLSLEGAKLKAESENFMPVCEEQTVSLEKELTEA